MQVEPGKFQIYVGPILIEFRLPTCWIPEFEATWCRWLKPSDTPSRKVCHHAQIDITSRDQQGQAWRHPRLKSYSPDKSVWHWGSDPRYFEQEPWLDWRGQTTDRRIHVDLGVRNVLAQLAYSYNASLMHASTVIIDDAAFVAPGKSGRGKTTFFKALGGYDAGHLHEDLAFIFEDHVYSVPCKSSSTSWDMPVPNRVSLAGFIELGRAPHPRVTTLTAQTDKLRVISAAIVYPISRWQSAQGDFVMATLANWSQVYPCLVVEFPRNVSTELLHAELLNGISTIRD